MLDLGGGGGRVGGGEGFLSCAITLPMSRGEAAADCLIASSIADSNSAAEGGGGSNSDKIAISSSSRAANSSRPAVRNCAAESRRCLMSFPASACIAASSIVLPESICFCFAAASSMRKTDSRNLSPPRKASCTRFCKAATGDSDSELAAAVGGIAPLNIFAPEASACAVCDAAA